MEKTGIKIVDWWNEGFSPILSATIWGVPFCFFLYGDSICYFFQVVSDYIWWMPFSLWIIIAIARFLWLQIVR